MSNPARFHVASLHSTMKVLVVLMLLAIVGSLFSGLVFLYRDRGSGERTVKALTLEARQRRRWEDRVALATQMQFRVGKISIGAHAVTQLLEKLMLDVMYDVPGSEDIANDRTFLRSFQRP